MADLVNLVPKTFDKAYRLSRPFLGLGLICATSACVGYKIRPVELEPPQLPKVLQYAEPEVVTRVEAPELTPIAAADVIYQEQVEIRQAGVIVAAAIIPPDGSLGTRPGHGFGVWYNGTIKLGCDRLADDADLCLYDRDRDRAFERATLEASGEQFEWQLSPPIGYELNAFYEGGPDRRSHARQIEVLRVEQSEITVALTHNFFPRRPDLIQREIIDQVDVIVGADQPTTINVDGVTLVFTHPLGEPISVRTEGQFLPWVDWFENGTAVTVENQTSRVSRR